MAYSVGMRLGPYELAEPLGAGGMGEVHRARDTRLGRDVAIKLLPQDFAKDEDRLRRFQVEAQATGTLNHPNILTIFDIGSHEGTPYVVSELLEGATLGEELRNGRLSVRGAVDYAAQLARGLAAAHDKGIFHRDVKPDNIFVTVDGRIKILDFGLAKLTEKTATSNSVMPTAATEPGMVLGTVGYMSPEQVRGLPADHRSDIFSFGAVLYEMIAGRRAFKGDSNIETMNAILKEDPPEFQNDPQTIVPPGIDRIIRHCLEKKAEQRFQSARDLTFALEALSTASGSAVLPAPVLSDSKPKRRWMIAAAAIALVLAAAAALLFRYLRVPEPPSWSGTLLGGPEIALAPRISPDGKTLAFLAMINNQTQVAVMDPANGNWTVLTQDRTRGPAGLLAWSSDGSRLYFERSFAAAPSIYSVPVFGGEERLIFENASTPLPLPDGSLLFSTNDDDKELGLFHFWPENGKREPLGVALAGEGTARTSRDGRHVVFFGRIKKSNDSNRLLDLDIASRNIQPVAGTTRDDYRSLSVVAPGHTPGTWLTVQLVGDLNRIIRFPGIRRGVAFDELLTLAGAAGDFDAGPDGSLYVEQVTRPQNVVRFGLTGGIPENLAFSERVVRDSGGELMLSDGRVLFGTLFSGHGRLVAGRPGDRLFPFVETSDDTSVPAALVGDDQVACMIGSGTNQTIAIVSMKNGQIVRRLKGAQGRKINALAASPDGRTIYFVELYSIWSIPASDGEPRKLATGAGVAPSPDGTYLIIQINDPEGSRLAKLPVAGGEPQPIHLDLGPLRMWLEPLSPNAVAPDGRIVNAVDSPDSWFERVAVIDPRSGHVQVIPTTFSGDIHGPGWTRDGAILALGLPTQSSIWRFRPNASAP